jgi:hypothetical protein
MMKIMLYLAAALVVAIAVALAGTRRQKPWSEMSPAEKRKKAVLLAVLGFMAAVALAVSGLEFKNFLDKEKIIGNPSLDQASVVNLKS